VQPCPGAIYDDDFQATTIDASKWNTFETNGTTSIESGHLDITIGTGVASAGVSGLSLYDFRNCSVTVEVLSVAAADDDAYTSLGLYVDASNEATAGYRGGYLYLYIKESGSEVSTGTIPYVAGKHRWWRLTEDGDITFYVSADGAAWSKVHSYATPQFLQSIRVVLTSGGQEIRNNPGTASFDNLSHSP